MRAVNEGNEGKIVIPCNPVGKIQLLRSSLENAQKYCTAESLKMNEQINPKQSAPDPWWLIIKCLKSTQRVSLESSCMAIRRSKSRSAHCRTRQLQDSG